MKINRKSWHFKLHTMVDSPIYNQMAYGSGTVTLCSYFWQTVLAILLFASFTGGASIVATSVAYALIIGPATGYILGGSLAVIGFIWIAIAAVFYGITVFYRLGKLLNKTSSSKDSILMAYIRAKKEKFCPIVELEDQR
ncbi:hypothetical protein QE320_gp031 [Pseudomonas phage EM]|uniref:Uncharacterized protein n=1 Tax=Pseudomonas phage EM TaxID=2936914 RepID=A0AAE9HI48_9CAUD|nr:hypothetical protein QE320_gp031 [Pseudomonas phage EM]UPW35833.1 hypothetical protein EM_031 [Pseudomonas phage EM]